MMKNVSGFVCKGILGIILCVLVLLPYGCGSYAQLGETEAEAGRRHLRTARINRQELAEDIDKAMLSEKPSKLTDERIP
ncbi:MAG: hypothetical protein ACYS6W_00260 [Planctomycetota bacterium]|jgi:hypothetical protein